MSRQIGEVPTRTVEPGAVIFREGDDAKGEAFMVHMGRVEIRQHIGGEERLLSTLAKGELLGHIALFRNAPRSATAIAADAVISWSSPPIASIASFARIRHCPWR